MNEKQGTQNSQCKVEILILAYEIPPPFGVMQSRRTAAHSVTESTWNQKITQQVGFVSRVKV